MKKSIKQFVVILLALVLLVSFAACDLNTDNEDRVEVVTLYVSAETGTYQTVPSDDYVEGILIKEGNATDWRCVPFNLISGFSYERGTEYELLVEKTTLANPPQDSGNVRYKLIRIVSQKKID